MPRCRTGRILHLACVSLAVLTGMSHNAQAVAAESAVALMPQPRSAVLDGRIVPITGGVRVVWQGKPSPLLKRAAARFERHLAVLAGKLEQGAAPLSVVVSVRPDPDYLSIREREHYTLNVAPGGVHLDAEGPAGVLRGFATLLQLVEPLPQSAGFASGRIDDAPRFVWRGIMIDVSRHFMSVDTIKRQLDAMELTKLNVLHWHLSDGTGFRVESKRFPKLQQVGGHNQYYTQAQVREIVAYAADRGIRVVPEFDIPGHTLSILEAYPELAAQQPVPLTKDWQQDCSVASGNGATTTHCSSHLNLNNPAFDPTNPQVLRFARELYAEMGRLFPDRYFHSGGDEVQPKQWTDNPKIAAYMKQHGYADPPALQAAFTAEVQKVLAGQGKIMMGWDEVSEAPIPKNVVVEAWRGSKWVGSATKAGHPVVVSSGYYLDLLNPSAKHYAVDPFDVKADGLSPEDAAKARAKMGPLADAFAIDPNAPPLDAQQQALVLGGEAPLWSEVVSDEMADARLWPRSAAVGERFWSDASVRDIAELERRLPLVQRELEALGLKARENEQRIIARVTPANIAPLTVLTSVTSPVRNYALNRLAAHSGDDMLSAPVAVAAPDSFEAIAFNNLAARYATGDRSVAAALQARLALYAGNDAAYAQIATTPALQAALPVSRQLNALAQLGQEAMEDVHHGKKWRTRAKKLLDEQDATFAASADHVASYAYPQPPSGLLIAIVPGIHALVNAAR
ncbi:hypothetical protein KBA01_22430 [Kozakia baliensis]|nr:hypothetical protein KBA01_22430 [Kozakia baliensis]